MIKEEEEALSGAMMMMKKKVLKVDGVEGRREVCKKQTTTLGMDGYTYIHLQK